MAKDNNKESMPSRRAKGDKNVQRAQEQNRQTVRTRNSVEDKQYKDDATINNVLHKNRKK
jgi:hypothetical protein